MSRSRRKRPFCGWTTARSERWWKRQAWQCLRRRVRVLLATNPEEAILPLLDEVANAYTAPKDGRQRFDPARWPEGMRK